VNGRSLIFFAGGNGVIYAFDELSHPSPGLRPLSPRAEGRGQGEGSASASANASAARGVRKLKKVWQFDFDPAAPKGDIHQYLSNRREGPSNIYGMPVFYRDRIYVAGGGDNFWGKNEAWLKCIDAPTLARPAVLDRRNQRRSVGVAAGCRWQSLPRHTERQLLCVRREQGKESSQHRRTRRPDQRHGDGGQWRALCRDPETPLRRAERRALGRRRKMRVSSNFRGEVGLKPGLPAWTPAKRRKRRAPERGLQPASTRSW